MVTVSSGLPVGPQRSPAAPANVIDAPGLPRLALLLLCHESPASVARRLAMPFFRHPDVTTYVHYDGHRPASQRDELRRLLPTDGRFVVLNDPVRCRWGDHTLVEATRRLMQTALADEEGACTHLILLSGSCAPYRPVSSLQAFLAERPQRDFIEAHDISQGRWVKGGLERERYEMYFPFNYRTQRRLFEWATARQREFRIRRAQPPGLSVRFGSQWFCLTRATATAVTADLGTADIRRWLRWSWIPDEFAVQTLVARHRPQGGIAGHGLTYAEFDAQGQPLMLENDHWSHLLAQPYFFARKVAPEARQLHEAMAAHAAQPEVDRSYFVRAGTRSGHYARFRAEQEACTGWRSHVGTPVDPVLGVLAINRRRYYVLHATSVHWLLQLLAVARGAGSLPIYDMPFRPGAPRLAGSAALRGFTSEDGPRRDHDRAAYLLEIIGSDPNQPAAFGIDALRGGWIRDTVRADRHATVIDVDPPLSREQRAAMALRELDGADDGDHARDILVAMRDGLPLPFDDWLKPGSGRSCQVAALRDLGPELGDATLLALRAAYHASDPAPHHIDAGAAWRHFWR